jgi:hypothetical protein
VQSIGLRAFDLVDSAAPNFVERAHAAASPGLLEHQGEALARPFETIRAAYAVGLASQASRLGYATRVAEFEQHPQADYSPQLEQFMRDAYQRKTFGADWHQTVCGTARRLLEAGHKELRSPQRAQLQQPVGIGHDAQRALCSWELGAHIHDSKADEAMKEITDGELAECWGYGYYLRACEMSLPEEARAELASVSGP